MLPNTVVRFFGRMQFHFPFLRTLINSVAQRAIAGEGFILRGVGKGLRFDATHCNPGYLLGTSHPKEQKLLVEVLENGDVFYNLGANAGFYAIIAARHVGHTGHVYAFEPTPELADRVRHNARINDLQNVSVVEAAVCDQNGRVEFGSEGFSVRNSIKNANKKNSICVEAVTLDEWSRGKKPPDVIMMDIEGAELDALQGARNLIRDHLPIMLIEVHWLGQDFTSYIDRELGPLGYKVTTYTGDALPTKRKHRYHALILPRDKKIDD